MIIEFIHNVPPSDEGRLFRCAREMPEGQRETAAVSGWIFAVRQKDGGREIILSDYPSVKTFGFASSPDKWSLPLRRKGLTAKVSLKSCDYRVVFGI
jgi:hypothetical protein